tara:strand:+ start:1397 stop:1777 length:381 start_codon:yes stop_codon:yes gene_type:complete
MKNLLLALCFVISNTILSQENFTGTWKSEKTDYTLVISKHKKANHFKFLNFKTITREDERGCIYVEVEYSPEEFIEIKKNKIYTFVSWEDYGGFYCNLIYESINKNKIKATLSGDRNMIMYYERIK